MKKTLSFAVVHYTIAFTVAYVLTGNLLLGGLLALLEPTVNTFAFYLHERVWSISQSVSPFVKTMTFSFLHFSIAFGVVYLMTGDALIGGMVAIIEPTLNSFAYYFHERYWLLKTSHQQGLHLQAF